MVEKYTPPSPMPTWIHPVFPTFTGENDPEPVPDPDPNPVLDPHMVETINKQAKLYRASGGGAVRESIGTKIKTDLVPYELIAAAAVGLNYGKMKYSARNFEKGFAMTDLLESIVRHTKAMQDGEDVDPDSNIPHFCLLASSIAMLSNNIVQGTVHDDRPVAKAPAKSIGEIAQLTQGYLNNATPIEKKA